METSDQIEAAAVLPRGSNPDTHWIGGWKGPRSSQELREKSVALARIQTPDLPVRSVVSIPTMLHRDRFLRSLINCRSNRQSYTPILAYNRSWVSILGRLTVKGCWPPVGDRRSAIRADVQSDIWGRVPLGTWHVPPVIRSQDSGGSNTIAKLLASISTVSSANTVSYIRH
jgi:hypothetical protein